MRKKELLVENRELREMVFEQGRTIVGLMLNEEKTVEDIRLLGSMGQNICPVCAHYKHGAGNPEKCPNALKEDCFEWRGVEHG